MRLPTLLMLLTLFLPTILIGQNVEALLEQADESDEQNYQKSLDLYLEVLDQEPDNFRAVWNAAFLYSKIGATITNADKKRDILEESVRLSEKALELRPNSVEANYVMGVAMGRLGFTMDAGARVKNAQVVKDYSERAIEIDSTFGPAWHLLGKLHYRLSNLNLAERAAAAMLYGGLPDGVSIDNALKYYKRAIKHRPDYILYRLDYAIALLAEDKRQGAENQLEQIVQMEAQTEDDPMYLERAEGLLSRVK